MLAVVYSGFRSLSPVGLLISSVEISPDLILITARCRGSGGTCPDCGCPSYRLHSRYERRLLDLPSQGRAVQLRIAVRQFRCTDPNCRRRIFAEPLGGRKIGSAYLSARSDRPSPRHRLGWSTRSRPGPTADVAGQQGYAAARVRRHAVGNSAPLQVIGIDDWAWKRGQRYGSIICDLERRRP
jgi:transposase